MNEIKINVSFEKRQLSLEGVSLVNGDYNSTKLSFVFDKEYEGRKIFELAKPKEIDETGEAIFVKEIENNEVVLVAYDENGNEASIFNQIGKYPFEISLYGEDSKLTSMSGKLRVSKEMVKVSDKVVEVYLPIFDQVMNEANETINKMNEMMENFSGGKIDDVQVNGKSVVKNKIANIDLSSVSELDNVLRDILEAIQSGVSASMVIEEIEQLIVEYFENKTVEEVED